MKAAQARSKKLNTYLCKRARDSNEINFRVSPVTGGGIQINCFSQLFLLARHSGKKTPSEWAAFAWEILSRQGAKTYQGW